MNQIIIGSEELKVIRETISRQCSPSTVYPYGCTALHYACCQKDSNLVKSLIEVGVPLDTQTTTEGNTALHIACQSGHLENAIIMIKNGADLNLRNFQGYTALAFACYRGRTEIVRVLVQANADLDIKGEFGPVIDLAVREQHEEIVEILIKGGAQLNIKNCWGSTPLRVASSSGNLKIVSMLLRHGADPSIADNDGSIPLTLAAEKGYKEIVEVLISSAPELLNKQTKYGKTPLLYASYFGHSRIVEIMLGHGADPNIQDDEGQTALGFAVEKGHVEIIKTLISKDANINIGDINGVTPLIKAAYKGYAEIVKILIVAKADPNIRINDNINLNGRYGYGDALFIANMKGNDNVAQVLINAGCHLNLYNTSGYIVSGNNNMVTSVKIPNRKSLRSNF